MEYDMWVMPTHEFLRLSEMRPHEELRLEGKLKRVDESMHRLFYISHEWTSSSHPDHSTLRLRTFQTILLRMLIGALPETTPTFADSVRLPLNTKISSSMWRELVPDSFVWIDFVSVRAHKPSHGSFG